MEDGKAVKLPECLSVEQDTEDSRFKLANDWFRCLKADAHDVFTEDILYHKKKLFFLLDANQKKTINQEETKILMKRKECEVYVMKQFLELFLIKVFFDSNVYLMT